MSNPRQPNLPESIRNRLLDKSKELQQPFDLVLVRYALERFLFRLSQSRHHQTCIVKGAILLHIVAPVISRATRDLDLLALGTPTETTIRELVHDICNVDADDDALMFDLRSLAVTPIRGESRYSGFRAKLQSNLSTARIPVQIDFGFGDAVTPDPDFIEYPTLLDMPRPSVLAYPLETVVAEKLEAIVELGLDNSRMKDYFDLWMIVETFSLESKTLRLAIERTFERRGQPLPISLPVGLSDEFAENDAKQKQWIAFQSRSVGGETQLATIVKSIRDFAWPLLRQD